MTAEQCLNHSWLHRKVPAQPAMEVTKDNLRQFVERWNEHPNSPYVFEMTNGHIKDVVPDSLQSLEGMSPSPCGSVVSSAGSDNAFHQNIDTTNNNVLMPPSMDHFRRSSDSTCVVKGTDVTERINLAEEIRKLSQKLFQLSTMSTITPPHQAVSEPAASYSPPVEKFINETSTNGYIKDPHNCVLPRDHPLNVNCGIPWRRTKFRISNMSRDVPLAQKHKEQSRILAFPNRTNREEVGNSPNGTKDLLLKLLEHWDGPQGPARPNPRHGSFSTEWTENDSLGQKTISSLNTFFQSRAASKKVTQFHKS